MPGWHLDIEHDPVRSLLGNGESEKRAALVLPFRQASDAIGDIRSAGQPESNMIISRTLDVGRGHENIVKLGPAERALSRRQRAHVRNPGRTRFIAHQVTVNLYLRIACKLTCGIQHHPVSSAGATGPGVAMDVAAPRPALRSRQRVVNLMQVILWYQAVPPNDAPPWKDSDAPVQKLPPDVVPA